MNPSITTESNTTEAAEVSNVDCTQYTHRVPQSSETELTAGAAQLIEIDIQIIPVSDITITYPAAMIFQVQEELKRIGSDRYNDADFIKMLIHGLCADWITYR